MEEKKLNTYRYKYKVYMSFDFLVFSDVRVLVFFSLLSIWHKVSKFILVNIIISSRRPFFGIALLRQLLLVNVPVPMTLVIVHYKVLKNPPQPYFSCYLVTLFFQPHVAYMLWCCAGGGGREVFLSQEHVDPCGLYCRGRLPTRK